MKYTILSVVLLFAGFGLHVLRTPQHQIAPVAADMPEVTTPPARQLSASLPSAAPAPPAAEQPVPPAPACAEAKRGGLAGSTNPQLRKLADYEKMCGGTIERTSFFAPLPTNNEEARSYADDTANTLLAFSRAGISPVVFLEPTQADGSVADVTQYGLGAYDGALSVYFAALKTKGVTDAQMGTWVILPEWNLPEWGSVDPALFTNLVTRTAGLQKQHFPASKASIMLDSQTYPSADSWEEGSYASLVPYVQHIPRGLIDSFGLQGFPWSPPANDNSEALTDPDIYLRIDLAAQAARALGVTEVWLNTGTFSTAYASDDTQRVTITPEKRKQQLSGVTVQAKRLQADGFDVAIHLFAENKAATGEGINWSYGPAGSPTDAVFKAFAGENRQAAIKLWLYDSHH